jgi:hypothetical protein
MKTKYLLVILPFLLLVTSCGRKSISLGDGGFLSSQDCGASCFLNIIPGVTKEPEVLDILKQYNYFDNCAIHKKTSESNSHGIVCYENISISINNESAIVESVGFHPSTEISVKDVIEKYGPPDMISVVTDGYPFVSEASLAYNEMHTVLKLPEIKASEYLVEPTNRVVRIIYSDPSTYSQFILQSRAQKWQGFVTYFDK